MQPAIFRAIADPTRRAILDLLREQGRPAGDIARSFPVSRPAISRHLRLLRRASLVREHREGRRRIYRLNPGPLSDVDDWLEPYREAWTERLERLKTFVEADQEKESERRKKRPPARKALPSRRGPWRPLEP